MSLQSATAGLDADDQQRLFLAYSAALRSYHAGPTDRRWAAVGRAFGAFHLAFLPGVAVPRLVRPKARTEARS